MAKLRWTSLVALAASAGCLSTPQPNDIDGGGEPDDAAVTDAGPGDGDAIDVDAAPPPVGETFPPASTTIAITGGWSGDLNGDGIDDVLLLNDTGNADRGVYLLFGQMDAGLPDFHRFFPSEMGEPLAVTATQLDGTGGLDIVMYAVTYNDAAGEAWLRAYPAEGTSYPTELDNHVTAIQGDALKPRTVGQTVGVVGANLDVDATVPAVVVTHERGAFFVAIPSWSPSGWMNKLPTVLSADGYAGAAPVPNDTYDVDDLIMWTTERREQSWVINDGHAGFTFVTVNDHPDMDVNGPTEAMVVDLDQTPPLDLLGYRDSGLWGAQVDDDPNTTTAYWNDLNYIPNFDGYFHEVLAFDTSVSDNDVRPELIAASDDCEGGTVDPCLYMLRNVYIDNQQHKLLSDDSPGHHFLPVGFDPQAMLYGDFDGDGASEIVVFSSDGAQDCVRVADASFSPCE